MIKLRRRLARIGPYQIILTGALVFAGTCAATPPDFPAPPESSTISVGQEMVINGRITSIRSFVSQIEVEEVVDYYKELWVEPVARGGPGYALEDLAMAPWRLVTRVEDGFAMTVQVQAGNDGSYGHLAISALPKNGEAVAAQPDPPSLRGSEVLSNISHNDTGQQGQTAVVTNKFSVARNVDFYRDKFDGWRVDTDKALAKGKMHALRFTRGRQNVVITINGGDMESEIVINTVRRSLL